MSNGVSQDPAVSRRVALQSMGAGVGAGWLLGSSNSSANAADQRPALRVAHLTDVHIQPELRANEGLAACLKHVQELSPKPDLILFGGDCVMDAFETPRDRTVQQWALWNRVLADCSIPWKGCIGNHDIWGWNKSKSGSNGDEADYGKKWAVEALRMPQQYYSFTQGGWKFIALDGVQPGEQPGNYSAYLDDEQFTWLKQELAATPANQPTLVFSHIPIVSIHPMLDSRKSPTSPLPLSAGLTHTDSGRVVKLLAQFPQVKLCLSGHLHKVDTVDLRGIRFHCNGAVSGAWWKGKHDGYSEGYALFDLFADGQSTMRYETYGWKAEA